jgi:hypothetical protein
MIAHQASIDVCGKTNVAMRFYPNRSNATNGDTVFVICKITNNSEEAIEKSTLTYTFAREFTLQRSMPESTISTNQSVFLLKNLAVGESRIFKVWAKVEAPDSLIGSALLVDAVWQFNSQRLSKTCSIIIIPYNVYPDLVVELRETHRLYGNVDYNLKIEGGYPPYQYYIDWGDGSTNKGGLREEGISELGHTYDAPGEYRINAYINDHLGKQAVIRKRVYFDPWGEGQ